MGRASRRKRAQRLARGSFAALLKDDLARVYADATKWYFEPAPLPSPKLPEPKFEAHEFGRVIYFPKSILDDDFEMRPGAIITLPEGSEEPKPVPPDKPIECQCYGVCERPDCGYSEPTRYQPCGKTAVALSRRDVGYRLCTTCAHGWIKRGSNVVWDKPNEEPKEECHCDGRYEPCIARHEPHCGAPSVVKSKAGTPLCRACASRWHGQWPKHVPWPLPTEESAPAPPQPHPGGRAQTEIETMVSALWNDLQKHVPPAAPKQSD